MTEEKLAEIIRETIRDEVRLGVQEAMKEIQAREDKEARERALNKSVEDAFERAVGGADPFEHESFA